MSSSNATIGGPSEQATEPKLAAALDYAAAKADIPVFPLAGKHPIEKPGEPNIDGRVIPQGQGGFHQATTDQGKIERWWDAYQEPNIGTPTGQHTDAITGQPNAHPFDVLDFDGPEGLAWKADYEDRHGPLPLTPVQITGSGGLHILFAHAPGLRNSAGKIAPGVDIRSTGGYIVLSPSIHPETFDPYRWADGQGLPETPLAQWPEPLLAIVNAASRRTQAKPGEKIPLGIQEASIMALAGAMRRQGAEYDAIRAGIDAMGKQQCEPPVADADLDRMAASACRYDPADPLLIFAKSDEGNAERFHYVNKGRALYCSQLRRWYFWTGTHWAKDDLHRIDEMAAKTARLTGQRAMEMPGGDNATDEQRREKAALVKWALASENNKRLTDMVKQARGKLAVRAKELDADPWLFNVKNGVIDLRTGQLRPHDPADLITKLAEVEYDPEATLPEWAAFLAETTAGKAGLADFLQLAVGYSLTGLTSEEKLFLVHGPAGSGKSSFVEAVKAMLGDYAATADFEAFIKHQSSGGPRNDIARLTGARYVSSIEVEQGKALAEALVKAISGGDTVAARFLYAESEEFKPSLKLWLVANDAPSFNADDTGMIRRILRLPFDNVVPDDRKDPRVKAMLTDPEQAGAAILAWAVKGCLRWQALGKLEVPEVVKADTERYLAEQDGLSGFLVESCELGPEHQCHSGPLFEAYESYWNHYGRYNRERRMTKQGFAKALARREGIEQGRPRIEGRQARGWLGIGVKELSWTDPEDE